MYQVRWQHREISDGFPSESEPKVGTIGKSVKLKTNCFRIKWIEDSSVFRYQYELPNPQVSQEEEKKIVEEIWAGLKNNLEHFVVRRPGLIFSPKLVSDFSVPLKAGGEVKISFVARTPGDQVNGGLLGPGKIVWQHIVTKLAERIQKVGKRYYNNCPQGSPGKQIFIDGWFVNMVNLSSSAPLLQLDVIHRQLSEKKITDVLTEICQGNESDVWAFKTDQNVADQWMRLCENATVVTRYNSRVYRIKAVRFDMSPSDEFTMYQRETKEYQKITYLKYFEAFYGVKPECGKSQPLLEAYPEKASEKVYLLPELCVQTGLTEEFRKDKTTMQEALKAIKAAPQERLAEIMGYAAEMAKDQRSAATFKAWGCSLDAQPVEVDARVLEPVQVAFQEKKVYPVEEGNFTKLLRNGLQCAVKLDDWLLIYPSTDESVLDIWLRSLRDIAQVAFGMQLVEPKRVVLQNQLDELEEALQREVQPATQLVLMLIPNKDSPKIYQRFKRKLMTDLPCISQVVKSETIRKRQSIAAVLSKVVLQINAKFSGPLWNIALKDSEKDIITESLKSAPFTIVGLDIHRNNEGERTLAMTATIDKSYSQHFSMSAMLGKEGWQSRLLQKIQSLFRSALLCFAGANSNILPEKIVVYRASVNTDDMDLVTTEVQAMQEVLDVLVKQAFVGRAPEDRPKITFITIARRGTMRLFAPSEETRVKNPEPGTVVDDPSLCDIGVPSFYLTSQAVTKGSATPSFYSVLLNENNFNMDVIQNLTYRLCLMFYNSSAAVRVPAPVLYAMKLAKMVGSVVQKDPHPSLQKSLFYL